MFIGSEEEGDRGKERDSSPEDVAFCVEVDKLGVLGIDDFCHVRDCLVFGQAFDGDGFRRLEVVVSDGRWNTQGQKKMTRCSDALGRS